MTSTIRPLKRYGDLSCLYMFAGKFQEFDFKNSTIVMKDLYGRTWKFKYVPNERTDNYDKLMFNEMVIAKDKSSVTKTKYIVVNTKDFNLNEQIFSKGDILFLFWKDTRKQAELIRSRKKEAIEMNGVGVMPVIKLKWQ